MKKAASLIICQLCTVYWHAIRRRSPYPNQGFVCGLWLILKRRILKTGEIPVRYGQHHATTEGNDFGQ
jgi:hypothetical protein